MRRIRPTKVFRVWEFLCQEMELHEKRNLLSSPLKLFQLASKKISGFLSSISTREQTERRICSKNNQLLQSVDTRWVYISFF